MASVVVFFALLSTAPVAFVNGAAVQSVLDLQPAASGYAYTSSEKEPLEDFSDSGEFDNYAPYAGDYPHAGGFQHGGGGDFSHFSGLQHSAHGESGDKGFEALEGFSKGDKGFHDRERHLGHYAGGVGHKLGYDDLGGHYGQRYGAVKGHKGASYGESKGHSKGQHTTGSHNVYHKDEYKKDRTFYDDSHDSGYYDRYGGYVSKQGAAKGGFEKGAKYDSGFREEEAAKKGLFDKGFFDEGVKGFKAANGFYGYGGHHQDFAKIGGSKGESEFGFEH